MGKRIGSPQRADDRVEAVAFRRALRRWYLHQRRDLPWRRTADPYAVWVSEVMLQQTTVEVAASRFIRFLARFPDVASLAAASEREVLAEWSGLGYYSRARNLHRAARRIAKDGRFPSSADSLRRLPGVGTYTAAAIASIAFGEPVAAVDGNVARVVSRLFVRPASPRRSRDFIRWGALASGLLDSRHSGDHNQAMMELGAMVCLPRAPLCPLCPVRSHCSAARLGSPERFPGSRPAPPILRRCLAAGVAFRGGRLVLVRDRHLVKGHVVVPLFAVTPGEQAARVLRRGWRREAGRAAAAVISLGRIRHSVLNRRYEVEVFGVREGKAKGAPSRVRLVAPEELRNEPRGGLLVKIAAMLPSHGTSESGRWGKARLRAS